jgi:hypothetical protein
MFIEGVGFGKREGNAKAERGQGKVGGFRVKGASIFRRIAKNTI